MKAQLHDDYRLFFSLKIILSKQFLSYLFLLCILVDLLTYGLQLSLLSPQFSFEFRKFIELV